MTPPLPEDDYFACVLCTQDWNEHVGFGRLKVWLTSVIYLRLRGPHPQTSTGHRKLLCHCLVWALPADH